MIPLAENPRKKVFTVPITCASRGGLCADMESRDGVDSYFSITTFDEDRHRNAAIARQ